MPPASNPSQPDFSIRTFQFRELALCYFPSNTPKAAAQAFRRMIRAYRGLPDLMAEKGYAANAKLLSPNVVEVLVKHLGEP